MSSKESPSNNPTRFPSPNQSPSIIEQAAQSQPNRLSEHSQNGASKIGNINKRKSLSVYLTLPLSGEGRRTGLTKSVTKLNPAAQHNPQHRDSILSKNKLRQQNPIGGVLATSHSNESNEIKKETELKEVISGTSPFQVSANMSLLQGTEHLFIRKCKEFPKDSTAFHVKSFREKREIINSSGRVIYFCGQTINNFKCFQNKFTEHVVDHNGRTVIIAVGKQVIPGVTASGIIYQSDGQVLGTITQEFCDAGYIVKDKEGRPTFRIRGPCYGSCTPCVFWCFEEHFEIDLEDGVTESGMISVNWNKTRPENNGMFGLRFPLTLESHQKASLLGAAFLIHFQYFRRGGNGIWICLLIVLLILASSYPIYHFYYSKK